MPNSAEIEKRNHHHEHHHHHHYSSHSGDEDESLSLSDLPLLSSSARHQGEENGERLEFVNQLEGKTASEDFDFCSLAASLDALESEMCIADEVFYRGQILPFRHSVSSAACTAAIPCSLTRSESMDRIVGAGFRSSSTASTSRSSSTRSSSINSSASADKFSQRHSNYITNSNHHHKRPSKLLQNQFQSSRDPRPYGGAASAPRRSTSSAQSPMKKSALWEIFRLGLVQTPEIELEDLKFRYGKHHGNARGGSDVVISGRSGSGNGTSMNKQSSAEESENAKIVKTSKKRGGMKLMKSCKCSVEAVEPAVAGRVVVVKEDGERQVEERKRKQDVTRHHRTFEWLRDLSHAVVLNDV